MPVDTNACQENSDSGQETPLTAVSRVNAPSWISGGAALIAAVAVGAAILLVSGENPITAYGEMLNGALGSRFAIGETLARAAPLAITAFGAAVALRAGLVTIGAQGSVILGAVGALLTAQTVADTPSWVAIPVAAAGGAVFGAAWVLIPALLKAYLNVNEILTTLIFTELATLLIVYLLNDPLKPPTAVTPQSNPFPKNGVLGVIIQDTRFHTGILTMIVAWGAYEFWSRSVSGFRIDLYGQNPTLAMSLGIPSKAVTINTLLVSGAAAGVVGWMQAAGLLQRLYVEIASDIGFFGLVVAFLGGGRGASIIAVSLLFGALQAGGLALQSGAGIPASLSVTIQAVILFGFSVRYAPQIVDLSNRVWQRTKSTVHASSPRPESR